MQLDAQRIISDQLKFTLIFLKKFQSHNRDKKRNSYVNEFYKISQAAGSIPVWGLEKVFLRIELDERSSIIQVYG